MGGGVMGGCSRRSDVVREECRETWSACIDSGVDALLRTAPKPALVQWHDIEMMKHVAFHMTCTCSSTISVSTHSLCVFASFAADCADDRNNNGAPQRLDLSERSSQIHTDSVHYVKCLDAFRGAGIRKDGVAVTHIEAVTHIKNQNMGLSSPSRIAQGVWRAYPSLPIQATRL
jgi:hypothetical protein